MKKAKSIILFVVFFTLFVFSITNSFSQVSKVKIIRKALSDSTQVDSLSLVPGDVFIYKLSGENITNIFKIDYSSSSIKLLTKIEVDSVQIKYRTFDKLYSRKVFKKDITKLEYEAYNFKNPYAIDVSAPNQDYFKTEGLNKTGSLSRGISFGNNQDVVVNSSLNLQLNGKLSENINLTAAISDNNIPIQPDGNTQQLQEFDRVYIQLNDEKSKLIVGDFQLYKPTAYFMTYNKRAQGGSFSSEFSLGTKKDAPKDNLQISAAVSRGKFSRNTIIGIERNQGPYRLRGAENELFIIVLANTERVYIDGELLKRGQENDYVINYNTSEITFTAKRIITKDKRIIAEFQYSDRNYARSLFQFSNEVKWEKTAIRFQVFSEQDNKNKPVLLELSDSQKDILRFAGDDLNSAIAPSIDTVEFNSTDILYLVKDTITNGLSYSDVYEYSVNPQKAFYKLAFSQVTRGNYIQKNSVANGKVFEWIAPVNGVSQGNYEPIILLISPKQKQMFVAAVDHQISKHTKLNMEIAATNNNINTFSNLDKRNDQGLGIKWSLTDVRKLNSTDTNSWQLQTNFDVEQISKNFVYLERYRSSEFERDWNRDFNSDRILGRQQLGNISLGLFKAEKNISYTYSFFNEQNRYKGSKHATNYFYKYKSFDAIGSASFLAANDSLSKSSFLRYKLVVNQTIFSSVRLSASIEDEDSRFIKTNSDLLLPISFHYREYQSFISNSDTTKINYQLKYIRRFDWGAKNEEMNLATDAQTWQFSFATKPGMFNQFKTVFSYRSLKIIDSLLTPQKQPDNTLLIRIEYNFRLLKGLITSNQFFETGSGLEIRKEFNYLEVTPGQGVYQWKDYNENGIKELNEFEIAAFKDQAKFIRVFTPTNNYVRTFNNQFNQVVTINPSSIFTSSSRGIKKFVAKFYNQSAFRTERKITNNPKLETVLWPFSNLEKDTSLASLNNSFRNTFSFNRLDPIYGIDYFIQQNKNRTLLVNGYEERSNNFQGFRLRVNGFKIVTLTAEIQSGVKYLTSDFFASRNYNLEFKEIKPELAFQTSNLFRISVNYFFKEKKNTLIESPKESSYNQSLGTEIKFNSPAKGTFIAKFQVLNLRFSGDANSPVGFEMLEGLVPGINYTWNATWQRSINNYLQLNLFYDGRKSPSNKAIHTGSMQLRAYF